MSTDRRPKDVMWAVSTTRPADLGQELSKLWGVHRKLAEMAYRKEIGLEAKEPMSKAVDWWLTSFCQLAHAAAEAHPERFTLFCQYYTRGPRGTWATASDWIEPLSRHDAEADLWEWAQAVEAQTPRPESKPVQQLFIMAQLIELRLKPMMLASAYLIRSIRDAKRSAGEPLHEAQASVWKSFFIDGEEDWGLTKVATPQMKTLGSAFNELVDGASMARKNSLVYAQTLDGIEDWLESLRNDSAPPGSPGSGTSRLGLIPLRNHALHGNYTRRVGGAIALSYGGVFKQLLADQHPAAPASVTPAMMDNNLKKIFGLAAIHTAWETYLKNLYYALAQWGYDVHHPATKPDKGK